MSNGSKVFRRVVPVIRRAEGTRVERWVINPDDEQNRSVWPTADVAARLASELREGADAAALRCAASVLDAYHTLLTHPVHSVAMSLHALRRAETGKRMTKGVSND